MDALTAAHPTLFLPALVEVNNLANRRSVIVRVSDRRPYRHNRLIDLSSKAALILGFKKNGTARARVKYIGRAPMKGDDRFEKPNLPTNKKRFERRSTMGRRHDIVQHQRAQRERNQSSLSGSFGPEQVFCFEQFGSDQQEGVLFAGIRSAKLISSTVDLSINIPQ
ncbi:MAG: hypothetical protein GY927_17735 [bacterium]|nr:hypothetical protein [bacterium]